MPLQHFFLNATGAPSIEPEVSRHEAFSFSFAFFVLFSLKTLLILSLYDAKNAMISASGMISKNFFGFFPYRKKNFTKNLKIICDKLDNLHIRKVGKSKQNVGITKIAEVVSIFDSKRLRIKNIL